MCVIALCVSDEESEHTAVCINAYRVERIVCTKRFDSALSFHSIVYILINVVSVRPAIKLKLASYSRSRLTDDPGIRTSECVRSVLCGIGNTAQEMVPRYYIQLVIIYFA